MDDPTVITEYIRDGGSVAAVVLVVLLFLKHLRNRETEANQVQKEYAAQLRSIATECHERHREAQQQYQDSLKHLIDTHERNFERIDKRFQAMQDGVSTLLERTKTLGAS
jgi:F0F1-type ATP synthase membrane subunit b/b'